MKSFTSKEHLFSLTTFATVSLFIGAVCLLIPASDAVVDNRCLGCLCEASTGCNASVGCFTPSTGGYFCGAFFISRGYWEDAGQQVLRGDSPQRSGAFEDCTNDLFCSAQVVRSYMEEFHQDCNNDGLVDCLDYAHIHVLGGYGCRSQDFPTSEFFRKFSNCFDVLGAAIQNTPRPQSLPLNP